MSLIFPPLPSGQKMISSEEKQKNNKKKFPFAFVHINRAHSETLTIKPTFLVVPKLVVYMVHMLC